jgi:ankyrin repeat protein
LREQYGFPLDRAIVDDRPDRVLALLRAGADPNASRERDRLPLRTAIDKRWGQAPPVHRAEIVALLLEHGADPNVRWCPFESRGGARPFGPCRTRTGVTPLMTAVAFDQIDVVALLLDAGADLTPDDWTGGNAFTFVTSPGVLNLLLARVFPDAAVRRREALDYLADRSVFWYPYDGGAAFSPLADAIVTDRRLFVIGLPAPPPPGDTRPRPPYPGLERLRLVLGLGADPDERVDPEIDWTPLGLAMVQEQLQHAEVLLQYGADPNRRWCTHPRTRRSEPNCSSDTGPTPLIWAQRMGLDDFGALLRRYGADPAATDHTGRTFSDYEPEPPQPRRR